jgi:Ca2+-binding RTX toxin-like protein
LQTKVISQLPNKTSLVAIMTCVAEERVSSSRPQGILENTCGTTFRTTAERRRMNMAVINGTSGADTIAAPKGNNIINAGGGDDVVTGGSGKNIISGGDGNDILYGGGGNDSIYGGDGNDILKERRRQGRADRRRGCRPVRVPLRRRLSAFDFTGGHGVGTVYQWVTVEASTLPSTTWCASPGSTASSMPSA